MVDSLQPHIQLPATLDVRYALLPGDPKRLDKVKQFLTDPQELAYNREYRSLMGTYKGVPVLGMSTGIGGPSSGIAVEELAAIGVTTLIRIGSSGALQPGSRQGDLILVTGAVRDEGTSHAYIDSTYPAVPDADLLSLLEEAAQDLDATYIKGFVRSHDSFYTDKEEAVDRYWSEKGIIGSDMETAALFVIGRLRGLKTASVLNVVVPYQSSLESGIQDLVSGEEAADKGETLQIQLALEAIYKDATR